MRPTINPDFYENGRGIIPLAVTLSLSKGDRMLIKTNHIEKLPPETNLYTLALNNSQLDTQIGGLPIWTSIVYLISMNIERLVSFEMSMGYQSEFGLDSYLSEVIKWLWEVAFFSPVIVSVFLIYACVEWRKKCRWALGHTLIFFVYIILGGVIGFIGAIVVTVMISIANPSPQTPLVIIAFAPL